MQILQQAKFQHTQTIEQAVASLQTMSAVRQREVFDFIDLICLREGLYRDDTRQDAPVMGDVITKLFADEAMTDEEVTVFEELRQDDDSAPIKFD